MARHRGEGTGAASPAEATAVELFREAESLRGGASVEDQSRTSTTTITTSGHSSSSPTSTTPTTGNYPYYPTTLATRNDAYCDRYSTLLAPQYCYWTVRRTAAMQLLQFRAAPESILTRSAPRQGLQGRRVQREKRFQGRDASRWLRPLAAPGRCLECFADLAWELDPMAPEIAFSARIFRWPHVDGTFRLASGRVVLGRRGSGRARRSRRRSTRGSVDTDEPKRGRPICASPDFLDVTTTRRIAFPATRIDRPDGDHWEGDGI